MPQQPDESTPERTTESSFGRGVSLARDAKSWSQRELARRVTDAGLQLDASAISRIESGSRSIRLHEAIVIADVLQTELDELLEGESSAVSSMRRVRLTANRHLDSARSSMAAFVNVVANIAAGIDNNPDVLHAFAPSEFADLESGDEYLDWVQGKLEGLHREYWYQRADPDEIRREKLNRIATAVAIDIHVAEPPPGDTRVTFPL